VKQSIFLVACGALLPIFFSCYTLPPPIPEATVQAAQSGGCGNVHGAFVETAKILAPRALHIATLLEDGTVLIAGGIAGRPYETLDSSEIYDPARGVFLASGTMTIARQQAVATRLTDGRVLIAGGFAKSPTEVYALQIRPIRSSPLDSAEIFDPKSRTFSSAGSMGFARIPHSATLLDDGKVLLIDDDSAKLFNPAAGTFAAAAKPLIARSENVAVKLSDGRVLIACGGIAPDASKSAEIYDPKSDRFVRTGDMVESLHWCHATLLSDGDVLLMGPATRQVEIYDSRTGIFRSAGNLLFDVSEPIPSRLNDGRVLVTSNAFPGYPLRKEGLTAEIYDPRSRAFTSIGTVPPERGKYTGTTLSDGSVLIVGGFSEYGPPYPSAAVLYCP
jgi:hypothetical protein